MSYRIPVRSTYDQDRSREEGGPRLTDENTESSVSKKIEELERASGEIKCAECQHIFELDELFGIRQCPKCYKVFCNEHVVTHAFDSYSRSRCSTCCK